MQQEDSEQSRKESVKNLPTDAFTKTKGRLILKNKITKAICMMLAVLMLAMMSSFASYAKDDSVTVTFTVYDGTLIVPKTSVTVTDGIAEAYGYDVATTDHNGNVIDSVTVFDAIVAVHKEYYGDAFTTDTAEDYLIMNYGFITKAFGKSSASTGFFVNDVTPNDGIYNEAYGSYTGYSCDTAELLDGDDITYFYYQDLKYWMDYKTVFEEDQIVAVEGETVEVHVSAFCSWYGTYTAEALASMTIPADGVDIYSADGTKLATTDADGNATLTFDRDGEYTIYTSGTVSSAGSPAIIDWATVTVNEVPLEDPIDPEEPEELTLWQKTVNFFKCIFNTVISFTVRVFETVFSDC